MRRILLATCTLFFLAIPGGLNAQLSIAPQVSWGDDVDFGLGGRVTLGLPIQDFPLEAIGSFDVFFPDDEGDVDLDYWEINLNAAYLFPIVTPTVTPYVGGGLNIAHASVSVPEGFGGLDGDDTELGLNLLGGVKFPLRNVTPYGELRIELGGGEQFVLTGGVAFNIGPGLSQ